MRTLRADSTPVEFYNEGLVVFLYDEESADAIREASPTLLEGFGEADARDPALARVARDGLLVAFELEQDDEVAIELAIGSPLTEDEAGDAWLPAGRAFLALPSGSLRVEGYNNLRLSPDYDPEEPGRAVDVPPGRYAVSLYRLPPERDDQFDEPDPTSSCSPPPATPSPSRSPSPCCWVRDRLASSRTGWAGTSSATASSTVSPSSIRIVGV